MIYLKQYDTARAITATLTLDGAAINLTGATVDLLWKERLSDDEATALSATIVTAAAGTVRYQPTADDVAEPGEFRLEWRVTFGDGTILTVPTNGRIALRIEPALA